MQAERAGFSMLWLSAAIVAADQLTKWIATSTMSMHERIPVLPFFMLDGRTAMAKHTKWIGFLLFVLLAVTVVIEALG